jgi:hypothetical protein
VTHRRSFAVSAGQAGLLLSDGSRRYARAGLFALVFLGALPASAGAQPYAGATGPHAGSVELSGGGTWTRGYGAGSADATLSRNSPAGAPPLTLFTVNGRVLPAAGGEVRVGLFLARRVSAEATFQYSRPVLRARITNDVEAATSTDADGTNTSYLMGGSLLYHFGSGHVVPFVSGGGGYLRQLHEANSDLLTGTEVHAGGGLKYWLGTGAHRFGFRIDAQASARSKSIAFEQKRRVVPTVGAGLAYQF